jgi:hypothetical protein
LKGGIPKENWNYLIDSLEKHNNTIVASFEMYPCTPRVMLRQATDFIFNEMSWPGKPKTNYTPKNTKTIPKH